MIDGGAAQVPGRPPGPTTGPIPAPLAGTRTCHLRSHISVVVFREMPSDFYQHSNIIMPCRHITMSAR